MRINDWYNPFKSRQPKKRRGKSAPPSYRPLGIENLEERRVFAVDSLNITSLTSAADTDGGFGGAEHVSVVAGSTVTVTFTYNSTAANATTAKFDVNTSPVTESGGFTNVGSGAGQTASLSLTIPLGTAAGTYNAHVQVKNGGGQGSTANDTDANAVVISVPITVIDSTTVNNGVPAGAVYNGSAQGITGVTVSDANGVIVGAAVVTKYFAGATELPGAPTDAGSYTVTSSYNGDATHHPSSDTDAFTVAKAPVPDSFADATEPYSGGLDAGETYVVDSVVAGDSNHLDSTLHTTVTITQVGSLTTIVDPDADGPIVYDGQAHGTTGSWVSTGTDGESGSATVTYYSADDLDTALPGAPINAGDYVAVASFSDNNHITSSASAAFTIAKAHATVSVTNYSGTYDGASHTASVVITGVGSDGILASNSVSRTNAGSDSTTASISGLQNYNDIGGTATIAIAKAALDALASTQGALNVAKDGNVTIALSGVTGIVDAQTVASLFNGATFHLSMAGEEVCYTTTATVVDGVIYIKMNRKTDSAAYAFFAQGVEAGEVNASKADTECINLSATTNGGNYTLNENALTKIFSAAK